MDEQGDAAVLRALADARSDLSSPHECRHYFYAPERATAKVLAKRLRASGYATQEVPTEDGSGHLVLVTHQTVPTLSEIVRTIVRETIREISNRPNKVVRGTFKGQQGMVDFYIKGNDVVVGKCGEFVTLLKGGSTILLCAGP